MICLNLELNNIHFKAILKDAGLHLCSSRHQKGRWCCQWCHWTGRCGLPAASPHTRAAAASPGSGRCHQTTIPGRSCPSRPARPGRAAPPWPAAPPRTHSGPKQRTKTGGRGRRSETPLLKDTSRVTRVMMEINGGFEMDQFSFLSTHQAFLTALSHETHKLTGCPAPVHREPTTAGHCLCPKEINFRALLPKANQVSHCFPNFLTKTLFSLLNWHKKRSLIVFLETRK